jgi:hypothetical protein
LEKILEPKEEPISYEITIHGKIKDADYIIKRTEFKDGKETVLFDNTAEYKKEREAAQENSRQAQITQPISEPEEKETKSEQRSQEEVMPKEDESDYPERYANVFPLCGSLQDILERW